MKKQDYFPDSLLKLRAFLELQLMQWPIYGAKVGLTPAQIADKVKAIQAQLDSVNRVLQLQADVAKAVEQRNHDSQAFADAYRLDVRRYKLLPGVDPAIFKAFGWVGQDAARPDPAQAQPVIGHVTVLPGLVELDFTRKGFDGVDAEYSTTGSGEWTRGDFDARSPYEDRRPLALPDQPETRYYRFRYRLHDEPVGQYSDVVRVVVS